MGNGFTSNRCPECGHETYIKDSRVAQNCLRRRRYQCVNGHRYTTMEVRVADGRGGVDGYKAQMQIEGLSALRVKVNSMLDRLIKQATESEE